MLFALDHNNLLPNVRRMNFCNYKKYSNLPRITDEYIFYLIIDGDMYIRENNIDYHLTAGDCILLQPGLFHEGYKETAVKYFYFHLHAETKITLHEDIEDIERTLIENREASLLSDPFSKSNKLYSQNLYIPKTFTLKDKTAILRATTILNECRDDIFAKYEHYKIYSASKILEFLVLLSREYITAIYEQNVKDDFSSKNKLITKRLTDFININYRSDLNIETIETYMKFSYGYLNTLYKKQHKITIGKYIQLVRINKAKRLIRETDLSFQKIAHLVGIEDPYYFSKLFKSISGYTPTKYAELINSEKISTIR